MIYIDDDIQEAFELFDTNQKGYLDSRELKAAMCAFNLEVSKSQIKQIFNELNKDIITEGIELTEFMDIMKANLTSGFNKQEIKKIFDIFDLNKNGKIKVEQLKTIANDIGEVIDDEELNEIIEEADSKGEGYICFNDFYNIMKKRDDVFYG